MIDNLTPQTCLKWVKYLSERCRTMQPDQQFPVKEKGGVIRLQLLSKLLKNKTKKTSSVVVCFCNRQRLSLFLLISSPPRGYAVRDQPNCQSKQQLGQTLRALWRRSFDCPAAFIDGSPRRSESV